MFEVQTKRGDKWETVWRSNRREFAIMRLAAGMAHSNSSWRIVDESGAVDIDAHSRVFNSLSLAGIA